MDILKYKQMFIEESRQHLEEMSQSLIELEKFPEDKELINKLFRGAHSMKGMAASMSYDDIKTLSHKLEDLLGNFRTGDAQIGKDAIDCVLDGVDMLEEMIENIAADSSESIDYTWLLERLVSLCEKHEVSDHINFFSIPLPVDDKSIDIEKLDQKELRHLDTDNRVYRIKIRFASTSSPPSVRASIFMSRIKDIGKIEKSVPTEKDIANRKIGTNVDILLTTAEDRETIERIIKDTPDVQHYEINKLEVSDSRREGESGHKYITQAEPKQYVLSEGKYRKPAAIKVKTEILDNLINIVGEMIIHNSKLEEINRELSSKRLRGGLMQLDNLVRDLHLQVMKLRMMPLAMAFDILPRIARDISRDSGKDIELELNGKDIELDRTIIEGLGDPLIHLIRNCADHGIEPAEDRRRFNKPEKGNISLSAFRENDVVFIEVEDDGRGIDVEKVKNIACKSGLIKEDEMATIKDEDVYQLLCHPGLSTAEKITAVSGRGVGMDVVKNKIESLGGSIAIRSVKGSGSKFTLKLPLTIAIINVFLFRVERHVFAIPLNKIFFVKDIARDEIKTDNENNRYFVFKEEEAIFLYDIKKRLKLSSLSVDDNECIPVVVVEIKGRKVGLIVDEFIRRHEIVAKPLGKPLERLRLFSGVTVMGDEKPVLILDVEKFM